MERLNGVSAFVLFGAGAACLIGAATVWRGDWDPNKTARDIFAQPTSSGSTLSSQIEAQTAASSHRASIDSLTTQIAAQKVRSRI